MIIYLLLTASKNDTTRDSRSELHSPLAAPSVPLYERGLNSKLQKPPVFRLHYGKQNHQRTCLSSLSARAMKDYLYHYTSVDAFEKMLRGLKDRGLNELTFWASNVHYMNDLNELSFLYDELVNALPELEKNLEIKETPFSMFTSLNMNQQGISFDLFKDIKENVFNKIFKSVFAISFSKQKDYLPMWSLYGNSGSGLCLEFDYEALKAHFAETDNIYRLIELQYFIKEASIWIKIAAFYKLYHDQLTMGKDDNPMKLCREFIARVLMEMAPLLKHRSYDYEKEVRLLYHIIRPGDADDIIAKAEVQPIGKNMGKEEPPKVRVRNGLLIPYKEIGIPIDFITKIIVGPTVNPQLQSEALKLLLKEAGQERIKVEMSTVSYRQM